MIPQKPPMIMVGSHVSTKDSKTVSTFKIDADNIFCEGGFFSEPGLIENMAQTAALGMGYLANVGNKVREKSSAIGYIGAIKNLIIHDFPKIGQTIQTEIEIEREIMDFSVVQGRITVDGHLIAECEMKIFQEKN